MRRKTAPLRPSKTRLLEAVKALDVDAVRAQLDAKPALLGVTDRQGRNLLHQTCGVGTRDLEVPETLAPRLAELLLDRGLEIDAAYGRDKCTALFEAVARARNPTLVRLLITRGAKVANAPGGGLFAAGWWDDVRNLELLLDHGARIDVVVGVTPFLASWLWRRFEAAKAFVRRGANVNYQDKKGRTALLHGVEREYDPALLRWLVDHGASPDIPDRDGVSARLRASRKRDKRFVAALGSN
jgi:ankyrin repeat protein